MKSASVEDAQRARRAETYHEGDAPNFFAVIHTLSKPLPLMKLSSESTGTIFASGPCDETNWNPPLRNAIPTLFHSFDLAQNPKQQGFCSSLNRHILSCNRYSQYAGRKAIHTR